MSNFLKNIAEPRGLFANRLRKRRFAIFLQLLNRCCFYHKKLKILDVGGVTYFWEAMDFCERENVEITILNLFKEECAQRNIQTVVGNGCDMKQLTDKEFDIVFSNSVIEHVSSFENQKKMANEIMRVGKYFFVQTPNYWFPFEPHFLTFGFQFLPVECKAILLRHFNLGWFNKVKNYEHSLDVVQSIRLLKKRELKMLFPKATIKAERFFGITKSFMVHNFVM